jgi:hypothetical protein
VKRTHRILVVGLVALVAIASGYAWFALNTRIGMFMGGGRYYVACAASTNSPDQARAYLLRVLNNTQYGVNIAENSVRSLPNVEDRMRLWRYLIELAPNDNWRAIYRLDLERESALRYRRP